MDGTRKGKDLSPNKAFTATMVNVKFGTGPDGRPNAAVKLMGKPNSFIQILNNGKLRTRNAITVAAWFYHDGLSGPIFSYNTGGIQLFMEGRRKLSASFTVVPGNLAVPKVTTNKLKYKVWNFVGATYDDTTEIAKLFVNGKMVAKKKIGKIILASTQPVRIGVRLGDRRFLRGRIACVQLYSVALNRGQFKRAMKRCLRQSKW